MGSQPNGRSDVDSSAIAPVAVSAPGTLVLTNAGLRTLRWVSQRVEDMLCWLKRECPVVVIHGRCARCLQQPSGALVRTPSSADNGASIEATGRRRGH